MQVDYQPSFLAFTEPTSAGRQSFKEFNKKTEVKIRDRRQDHFSILNA